MVESSSKLFAGKFSHNSLIIQAAAKASNFALNVTDTTNECCPVCLEVNGSLICGLSEVLRHITSTGPLAAANESDLAEVTKHQATSKEVASCLRNIIDPIFGLLEMNDKDNKADNEKLKGLLSGLEKHITGKTYLVGEKVSAADFDLWSNVRHLWQLVFVDAMRSKVYPNLDAWFARVSAHESILATFGVTLRCKVAVKAPKVEKKVEEKPAKVKDDDDEDEKPKEKSKEPSFPESKMDLDAFKKDFMNSTDRKSVLDNFFETQYDPQGFSIFYTRYQKLASECKELWKTENAPSFFLQKIDSYRKHAFSVYGIYGVEGDYEIKGVWLWRGVGIPFFMEQHESFEYYDRRQLDPSNPEDKQTIYDYWLKLKNGDTVDGLPVVKVDTFK